MGYAGRGAAFARRSLALAASIAFFACESATSAGDEGAAQPRAAEPAEPIVPEPSADLGRVIHLAQTTQRPIHLGAGEYELSSRAPVEVTEPLVLRGQGTETVLRGDGTDLLRVRAPIRVERLAIEDAGAVFSYEAREPVTGITLRDLRITGSGTFLAAPPDAAAAADVTVERVYVNGGEQSLGILWRAPVDDFRVTGSRFVDSYRRAIQVGDSNAGKTADAWSNVRVLQTVVAGVDGRDAASTYGIHIVGAGVLIRGNALRDITQADRTRGDGIYTAAWGSVVAENRLEDIQNRSAIQIKGAPRRDDFPHKTGRNLVTNNVIRAERTTRRGINVSSSDVTVRENAIGGGGHMGTGIQVSGGPFDDVTIVGNTVRSTSRGISSSAAGDRLAVASNRIVDTEGHGINIDPTSGLRARIDDITVRHNHITATGGSGVYVRVRGTAEHAALRGVRVTGNNFRDVGRHAIHFSADAEAPWRQPAVEDNAFFDVAGLNHRGLSR